MKKPELIRNTAEGLDLILERDAGNPVRILTGKNSLKFFKELKKLCEQAIDDLDENSPPLKNFKVVWEIEINAKSPIEAAKEAQRWLQAKGNDWQFYIQEDGKNKPIFSVDLSEEDENAALEVDPGDYSPMIKNF